MKVRGIYWWDLLRDQLWFFPSVACGLAGCIAIVALWLDRQFALGQSGLGEWIQTTGPAARTVLGALIGGLVTVTGLIFSVAMMAVSQTATQYGPRLIRNVLESPITQLAISLHVGTVVYSMIVLRAIREASETEALFTPNLSVLCAELSAAACLFSLLAFANQMTRTMRAETLLADIYARVVTCIQNLYPNTSSVGSAEVVENDAWSRISEPKELVSNAVGYVQAVDLAAIFCRASEEDERIEIVVRPGDFVRKKTVLALLQSSLQNEEPAYDAYRSHFLLGPYRTTREDVEAGILELVEAGVRALSPGTNDPRTAINVIDYLGSALADLALVQWPGDTLIDKDGVTRVKVDNTNFAGVLNAAFDQLRQYSGQSIGVLCRLVEALGAIRKCCQRKCDQEAVDRQLAMLLRKAESEIAEPNDLEDIRERVGKARAAEARSSSA